MNKKWQVYQVENEKVEELEKKYKINKLLATILVNRGIIEENQIEKFLKTKTKKNQSLMYRSQE